MVVLAAMLHSCDDSFVYRFGTFFFFCFFHRAIRSGVFAEWSARVVNEWEETLPAKRRLYEDLEKDQFANEE